MLKHSTQTAVTSRRYEKRKHQHQS